MPKCDADIGALSTYFAAALDDSPVVQAATGEALLYAVHIASGTSPYVQIFDALVANITLGTTVPKMVLRCVANAGVTFAPAKPVAFKTGIAIASTNSATGATGVASDVTVVYG